MPEQLKCPWVTKGALSCVIEDGEHVYSEPPVRCIGCGKPPSEIEAEKERQRKEKVQEAAKKGFLS